MDVFGYLRRRRLEKRETAHAVASKKQKQKIAAIPLLALVVANLLVLSLDYRVVEAVYHLTKNPALALFAIFTTGAIFILWFDVLYRYLLANGTQNRLSLVGSGLALIGAGVFAFLDYDVSVDLGRGIDITPNASGLFWGMVVLTVIHAALLFWWYIIDDQVSRARRAAKEKADNEFDLESVGAAEEMLKKTGEYLKNRQALIDLYGAAAVNSVLNSLMGLEEKTGIDINGDGVVGVPVQMAQTVDAPPTLQNAGNPTPVNTPTPRP